MKKILLLAVFLAVPFAEAEVGFKVSPDNGVYDSLPGALKECSDYGYEKVLLQAESYGVTVDPSSFEAIDMNANPLATYIWWKMDIVDNKGRTELGDSITKLTQKPLFGECF